MKHLSSKLLAEKVSSRRKALNLSQSEVAEKTKINRSLISRMESGEHVPTVEQLLALADLLGFEISELIVEDVQEVYNVERTQRLRAHL